jgi:hypothetical protein
MGRVRGDRFRAGQAVRAGGPRAASNRFIHSQLAVPVFGQVQRDVAAAVPGDPGGHGDEVAADGRAAGPGVESSGEAAGGAGQVMRNLRDLGKVPG